MSENRSKPELIEPDVERDAPISLEWINGDAGRETLVNMGNLPESITATTLEAERQRVRDFLEADNQRTWMIKVGDNIVGATWVDLKATEYLAAPAVHIMIGDASVRGDGVGSEAIQAVISKLRAEGNRTLYSRHLSSNEAAAHLLEKQGFENDGEAYQDADNLLWQNMKLRLIK